MPSSQVSRTITTREFTKGKTSITVALLAMIFKIGMIVGKFRTASSQTSPSVLSRKNLAQILKLTQTRCSLATETEYVRGKLADYANDLLLLGTDGFRIDAAKRKLLLA